jgi:hypothetical protein
MFDFIVTLVETIFFIFPLIIIKEIKSKKVIAILYLSIVLISLSTGTLLQGSIFKYVLFPILIFIYLKYFVKETNFYDFFIIVIEQILKTLIEFACYLLFFNKVDYIWFVIIMEALSIFIIFLFGKFTLNFYKKTIKKCNGDKKFYYRYILLILFNSLILFTIYNLILMKGVI